MIIKGKMKLKWHKNLTLERWSKFSFYEQMGNIGAEIGRTINWREKEPKYSRMAFERGLELLYLTIKDPKNKGKRFEMLCLLKKVLINYFCGNNQNSYYNEVLDKYFLQYALAARKDK
jgi:hypothetical protein